MYALLSINTTIVNRYKILFFWWLNGHFCKFFSGRNFRLGLPVLVTNIHSIINLYKKNLAITGLLEIFCLLSLSPIFDDKSQDSVLAQEFHLGMFYCVFELFYMVTFMRFPMKNLIHLLGKCILWHLHYIKKKLKPVICDLGSFFWCAIFFILICFSWQHFVCAKCEKPFLGTRYYEKKNLAYCENHYHQVSGHLSCKI